MQKITNVGSEPILFRRVYFDYLELHPGDSIILSDVSDLVAGLAQGSYSVTSATPAEVAAAVWAHGCMLLKGKDNGANAD